MKNLWTLGKKVAKGIESTAVKKHKEKWKKYGFMEELARYRGALPMRTLAEQKRLIDIAKRNERRADVELGLVPVSSFAVNGKAKYPEYKEGALGRALTLHIGADELVKDYKRGIIKAATEVGEAVAFKGQPPVFSPAQGFRQRIRFVPVRDELSDDEIQMIDDVVDFIPQIVQEEADKTAIQI